MAISATGFKNSAAGFKVTDQSFGHFEGCLDDIVTGVIPIRLQAHKREDSDFLSFYLEKSKNSYFALVRCARFHFFVSLFAFAQGAVYYDPMKRMFLLMAWLGVLVGSMALQGCGQKIEITIPKSQIDREVKARFPVTRSGPFTITLQNPDLKFQSAKNRIDVDTDVTVRTLGLLSMPGHANVDGKLEFHPEDASIRLGDIKVHKLNIRGLPEGKHEQVIGMIGNVITPVLKSINLYQFDKNSNLGKLAGGHLRGFRVKDDSLVVIIGY